MKLTEAVLAFQATSIGDVVFINKMGYLIKGKMFHVIAIFLKLAFLTNILYYVKM